MTFEHRYAGYEGVRSLQLPQPELQMKLYSAGWTRRIKDANGTLLYANVPMKAAYGTFLETLLVIKCHDMVADAAANRIQCHLESRHTHSGFLL